MLGASGDGDVATVGQRNHAERVFQTLLSSYVAGHDGDSADIELRRVQSQHQGHGVVSAGIGVEDNFLGGGCGDGQRHYDECGYEELLLNSETMARVNQKRPPDCRLRDM